MVLPNRFFMLNFKTLIESEYESAYESAYDLSLKPQFSTPKIYTAKGDLKQRWYVYFSYRNTESGKLVRQTPFYGNANTYKTKEDRMAVLSIYRKIIYKYLKAGYNPYLDNTEAFLSDKAAEKVESLPESKEIIVQKPIKKKSASVSQPLERSKEDEREFTVKEAFEFVDGIKVKTLRESSLRSYRSHVKIFREWLEKEHKNIKYLSHIKKNTVTTFLHHILENSSARNRNNSRASLSSLFETLFDNDMIALNFVKSIKKLKTTPTRHVTYPEEMQEQIFEFLEKNDAELMLYIKFVAYSFLRPIEVCRLKVGDINVKQKTVSFMAKNSPLKTKIIPEILFEVLPDLSTMDKDAYLFTAEGIGKYTETKLENRRGYFTEKFKKLMKGEFELEFEHTLYSFRHTFITKIYRELRKKYTPYEAKSNLMQITGHSSMTALNSYLRDIDAELPEDYSAMLRKKEESDEHDK